MNRGRSVADCSPFGRRRSVGGHRWASWRLLPILVAVSLLISLGGAGGPAVAVDASYEGEQTAQFLPADIALYTTVNLDPSADQLTKFRTFLNYWWQDPNVKARWAEFVEDGKSESDIDVMTDVLPWLGPEIAMGLGQMSNVTSEDPDVIVFIGTMNKQASDAFVFDKFLPYLAEDEEIEPGQVPSEPTGTFNGIDTLYDFPGTGTYWAFTDDYVIVSFAADETLLESSLELISTPDPSASLAGSADFQEAQDGLPVDRVGMVYCNYESLWAGATGAAEGDLSAIGNVFDTVGGQLPAYLAASLSFSGSGLSMTAYSPMPEGVESDAAGSNALESAAIVPGDALLFVSSQNANGYWQQVRSEVADTWAEIAPDELPEGIDTFDDMIDWLDLNFGFDVDEDIFGWMTGEFSIALLSLTFDEEGDLEGLDLLVTFEVEDPSAVEEQLGNVIDGVNSFLELTADEGVTPDLIETSAETIGGVDATLVNNDGTTEAGTSPGWLFLDSGGNHYLVFGSTVDALEAAVDAGQGQTASLDETEAYQGVLSLSPTTRTGFAYINLTGMLETSIGQASADEMTEEDIEFLGNLIPLNCALGFSVAQGEDGVSISGAIYVTPPSLAEAVITEGVTQTVEIAESFLDFSDLDTAVGKCSVSLDVDISDAPAGAKIDVSAMKDIPEDVSSGFELAATDSGMTILDVAYGIRVDKTNLTEDNIGAATVTMKVGREWADAYGLDNVKVFRVSDGTSEVLPTTFVGYEDDYAVFEGLSENGLSYFGLVAVSQPGGLNWALVGGLVGGLLVLVIVLLVLRRARAAA